MAASSFTLRVGGNVALQDGGVRMFNGFFDGRVAGQIVNSEQAFKDVLTSFQSTVDDLVDALLPTVVNGWSDSSSTDSVDSFSMHLSGNVAFDDNTISSFDWEVTPDGDVINHMPDSTSEDALNEVAQVETLRVVLESVLDDLLDTSTVTVAA